jgi:hypothetical protein
VFLFVIAVLALVGLCWVLWASASVFERLPKPIKKENVEAFFMVALGWSLFVISKTYSGGLARIVMFSLLTFAVVAILISIVDTILKGRRELARIKRDAEIQRSFETWRAGLRRGPAGTDPGPEDPNSTSSTS